MYNYIGEIMKKLFIFDFDGTLVKEDILDVICEIVEKKEESRIINEKFIIKIIIWDQEQRNYLNT